MTKRGPTPGARTIMMGAKVKEATKAIRCETPRNRGLASLKVVTTIGHPTGRVRWAGSGRIGVAA
ncbi:MAG: hypothetical protein Ct9H300mP31_09180 [Acidimicrobiaceae bacterium]|nr:MAG: hypothetical protein Ct9H300mP31_09180 [Acidimicrobiaceae bacterium]